MPIHRIWSLYVSPDDDCHAALLETARAAQTSLHVLVYSFTLPDLASILIQKKQAGLNIGVVVDKGQTSGKAQRALMQKLVDSGVSVTMTTSQGNLMHMKVLIVDYELGAHHNISRVAQGSYNFSKSAQKQINSLLINNDATVVEYMYDVYEQSRAYGASHYEQLQPRPVRARRRCTAKTS